MTSEPMKKKPKGNASERLIAFLGSRGLPAAADPLTPDASTRTYFRIPWGEGSAVACVYPEPFDKRLPFLDTTALFQAGGVPVADVLHTEPEMGILVQEDLGDRTLAEVLRQSEDAPGDALIDQAIRLIARIQAATGAARDRNSIAYRLRFDREKLEWELDFFLEHHFGSLLKRPLMKGLENGVRGEFKALAEELEEYSRVLTHRDFHASNLMVKDDGGLALIDHQDARLGSAAYDLVSLLLDRVTEAPDKFRLERKRALLLGERERAGLESIDAEEFAFEFDIVAVQRCLKAIGTFSNQAGNFGRSNYIPFIAPMFGIVEETCKRIGRYPAIIEMITVARGRDV